MANSDSLNYFGLIIFHWIISKMMQNDTKKELRNAKINKNHTQRYKI